jgi:hypothetical protein
MMRIAIIFTVIVLMAAPLFAAGITTATKPLDHMKVSVAVEDNYIFSRDIEKPENRTKFEVENINQVYANLGLGLTPCLNLYAKLGISDAGEIKDETTSDANQKIETDYGFLWGVGASYTKEISNGWKVGLDAQFDWWKADADTVTYNDVKGTNVSGEILNFEYQATPFITKKFDIPQYNWAINPYLGLKFSYFKTQTDKQIKYNASGADRDTSWSLKGDDNIGIVVGSDLEINENVALQVEGRFIDETAITAGGIYKF